MKTKSFILLIAGIILVGAAVGGAFLGGETVGKNNARVELSQQLQSRPGQFGNGARQQGGTPQQGFRVPGAGGAFGGGAAGIVQTIDGNTLTLTTQNGSTVRVVLGANTTVEKMMRLNSSDITAGSTVMVNGQRNTDGSIQAVTVVINQN